MQNNELADLLERSRISQLLCGWGLWRDTCDWARLSDCYTADAYMLTTWFDGAATDFVEASKRMAAAGSNLQHYIGVSNIEINGDRALAVTRVELHVRAQLDATAVDATCYGRFHDRLLRQEGQWRIQSRVPVYEKDAIRAVHPGQELDIDPERLARFPAHYQYLAYLQSLGGATITPGLPAPNSPEEHSLRQSDLAWLDAA
ncbi:MAG: nuclear transport factor 2 family protein [Pseudomonadota bacterium]